VWRKVALQYHPDTSNLDAEIAAAKFRAAQAAFEKLQPQLQAAKRQWP
jgi:curved DNA-binding protein CbpA